MKKALFASLVLFGFAAHAWMEKWAPETSSAPAKVRKLPQRSVDYFVGTAKPDEAEFCAKYSEGGALDLNGDGVEDFMFIIPWMGCGLNAAGYDVHFIVSDGAKGRVENVMEGYGVSLADLVTVGGKTYFRQSLFFEEFERSKHNHWVYQMFSFGANGVMKCANAAVGRPFPAVTIFYDKPKFKPVELTAADLKKIQKETKVNSHKYMP